MQGKSVPWDSVQTYLATLTEQTQTFGEIKSLKNKGILDLPFVETKVTGPMYHMYDLLCRLLNESNLIESDQSSKGLEVMVSTVTTLQDSIASQMALN